jgi:hypothetical protein
MRPRCALHCVCGEMERASFTPSELPATIYGNNEITCGNAYSTLYHVTAWSDSGTKLAGDLDYDLCSTMSNCLGYVTSSWNLAQSQPFTGTPPPPALSGFLGPLQALIGMALAISALAMDGSGLGLGSRQRSGGSIRFAILSRPRPTVPRKRTTVKHNKPSDGTLYLDRHFRI